MTDIYTFFKKPLNLFVIILLCLVLLSCLGMYREGFVTTNGGNGFTEQVSKIYVNGEEIIERKFTSPNGNTAEIYKTPNGKVMIIIIDSSGKVTKYSYSTNENPPSSSNEDYITDKTVFYGPFGDVANIAKGPNGKYLIQLTDTKGNPTYFIQNTSSSSSSTYSPSSSSNVPPSTTPSQSYPSYSKYSTIQSNQQPYTYPLSQQQQQLNNNYADSLPPGIPSSQIPPGQEDLYILKSEVIPPVCPVCPSPITSLKNKTDECAPCPPCARCPKPAFECKKVPSYTENNDNTPNPILSPYSTYGT